MNGAMKNKTKEKLMKTLVEMRKSHKESWDVYGSELCAGEMIKKEELLEDKIKKIENEENIHNLSSNSSNR